jgi:DNA-directed RNA polymerase subunit H (RpoH/RPB5)
VAARRQTVIAVTAGALIALALGVLGILHATAFDPETVRVEAQSRYDQLNRIPENDPIAREALAKELLANEQYREHAKGILLKIERAYPKVHEAATLERTARREVPPFLAKCKDLRRVPLDELDALHGEGRSLLRNYGTTRYGDELRKVVDELKVRCGMIPRCTANDVVALSGEVQRLLKEGKEADAEDRIREFVKKYLNIAEFETRIRGLEQQVVRYRAARELKKR